MFTKYTPVLVILLLALVAVPAAAGEITPGLAEYIDSRPDDEVVKVLVVMDDQVDVQYELEQLVAARTPFAGRHAAVLGMLQSRSNSTQVDIRRALVAGDHGAVEEYRGHWLINAVSVRAPISTVRQIAAREDVLQVEPYLVPELIEPVSMELADGSKLQVQGTPVAPGLESIRVPDVWTTFGIDGTGVLVATIDSGVDGAHPVYADRWNGNFVPPSQAWLDIGDWGSPDFPIDLHGHGTHVMGTITGDDSGGTAIGVAPGARWMASNAAMNDSLSFEADMLAAFEWMADPDGDPLTTDDVPDVLHNSWGMNEDFGYVDCYSYWWTAIDNCEAAGVVVTFSAGNEGPGSATLRSPADRATSALNAFSIGSISREAPFEVSLFSSRGPSGCGGAYATKPEVVAPGEAILSAWPDGASAFLSGTSMAGPHVAGVAALMRQANPDATVAEIKQALIDTAIDMLPVGEDNDTGHGRIDAYEAVKAIMTDLGTVAGVVTVTQSGLPLAGATISHVGGVESQITDASGTFSFDLPAGPQQFAVSKFGFTTEILDVVIVDGGIINGDVSLAQTPIATVSGVVTDPDGLAVEGVEVRPDDVPVASVYTDSVGVYAIDLPVDPANPYVLRFFPPADRDDLGFDLHGVLVTGSVVLDAQLPVNSTEDFESGDLSRYPWVNNPDGYPWNWIVDLQGHESGHSASAVSTANSYSNTLQIDWDAASDDEIRFWVKTSTEDGYDFLRFFIDDVEMGSWSGETPWTEAVAPVTAGPHTFRWTYDKDAAAIGGEDRVWIDDVTFPLPTIPPLPAGSVDLSDIAITVMPNSAAVVPVQLSNTGEAPLDYVVRIVQPPEAGHATPPLAATAAPDAFGHVWRDSTDPQGPSWSWVNISAIGTDAGNGDDAILGPFPLGFTMPYYENTYDRLWINTNGAISFSGDSSSRRDEVLPTPGAPDDLLAVFWDDLRSNQGGTIYYYSDLANERFIVQFQDVIRYRSGVPHTFQVILYASGDILYQYADIPEPESSTVGIENSDGSDGLTVSHQDAAYPYDGLAIMFTRPKPVGWASAAPNGGSLGIGLTQQVDVTFDTTGLAEGVYRAELGVQSNDPMNPLIVVPVTLNVTTTVAADPAVPTRLEFAGAFPNPFNPATTLRFSLPADGQASLKIYDVSGRLVRTLLNGWTEAGPRQVLWRGTDHAGRTVSSGVYYARLVAAGEALVRPLVLIR